MEREYRNSMLFFQCNFFQILQILTSYIKSPTGFEKFDYEDRLKRQSLTTLQDRRMIGDLDISGPAVSVRWNSLSMHRESFTENLLVQE